MSDKMPLLKYDSNSSSPATSPVADRRALTRPGGSARVAPESAVHGHSANINSACGSQPARPRDVRQAWGTPNLNKAEACAASQSAWQHSTATKAASMKKTPGASAAFLMVCHDILELAHSQTAQALLRETYPDHLPQATQALELSLLATIRRDTTPESLNKMQLSRQDNRLLIQTKSAPKALVSIHCLAATQHGYPRLLASYQGDQETLAYCHPEYGVFVGDPLSNERPIPTGISTPTQVSSPNETVGYWRGKITAFDRLPGSAEARNASLTGFPGHLPAICIDATGSHEPASPIHVKKVTFSKHGLGRLGTLPSSYTFSGALDVGYWKIKIDPSQPFHLQSTVWEIRGTDAVPTGEDLTPVLLLKGSAFITSPVPYTQLRQLAQHQRGAYYVVDLSPLSHDESTACRHALIEDYSKRDAHIGLSPNVVIATGQVSFYNPEEGCKMVMIGEFALIDFEDGCHYALLKGSYKRHATRFHTDDLVHYHPVADLGIVETASGIFDIAHNTDYSPILLKGDLVSGNRKIVVDLKRITPKGLEHLAGISALCGPKGFSGTRRVYSVGSGHRLYKEESRCFALLPHSDTDSPKRFTQPEMIGEGKKTYHRDGNNYDKGTFVFCPSLEMPPKTDSLDIEFRAESLLTKGLQSRAGREVEKNREGRCLYSITGKTPLVLINAEDLSAGYSLTSTQQGGSYVRPTLSSSACAFYPAPKTYAISAEPQYHAPEPAASRRVTEI